MEDSFVGRQLGRYEIHARLAVGGMSEVFLASYRGAGGFRRAAVLKRLRPGMKQEPDVLRMFLNEGRMMALFSHPHIAQVYDLDVIDDELFLAMEYVSGASLIEIARAVYRTGSLMPIGLTLMAVRDTARALHHAHTFTDPSGQRLAVVHRDVTQRNIMMTFDGITKLIDFGIAKLPDRDEHTATGTLKGTSGYFSPEQIRGRPADARSDVFSLGVVLHECLTGLRLFSGRTPAETLRRTLTAEIPAPSVKNVSVPPALDAVVARALARERDDRFASALDLARALEDATPRLFWRSEDAGTFLRELFAQRHADVGRHLASLRAVVNDLSDDRIQRWYLAGDEPLPEITRTSVFAPLPDALGVAAPPPMLYPTQSDQPILTPREMEIIESVPAKSETPTLQEMPIQDIPLGLPIAERDTQPQRVMPKS